MTGYFSSQRPPKEHSARVQTARGRAKRHVLLLSGEQGVPSRLLASGRIYNRRACQTSRETTRRLWCGDVCNPLTLRRLPGIPRRDETGVQRTGTRKSRTRLVVTSKTLKYASEMIVRRRVGLEHRDGPSQTVERALEVASIQARRPDRCPHPRFLLLGGQSPEAIGIGQLGTGAAFVAGELQDLAERVLSAPEVRLELDGAAQRRDRA